MSQMRELREQFPTGEVLRESSVSGNLVQGVSLLGKVSENGRLYTDAALEDAVDLYAGVQVFLDHPTSSELRDREGNRSVRDLVGRIRSPRVVAERVKGDVELLDREPTKSLVVALAEQMPDLVGMSHRARGEVRQTEDGGQMVTSLAEVFAVELVTEPATVSGLLESLDRTAGRVEEVREELIARGVPEAVARENPTAEWIAGIDDPEARQEAIRDAVEVRERYQKELGGGSGTGPVSRSSEKDPDNLLEPERKNENGTKPVRGEDIERAFGRLF